MHIFPIGTSDLGILVTGKTWRVLAFSPTHSLGLGSTRTLLTSPWAKSTGQKKRGVLKWGVAKGICIWPSLLKSARCILGPSLSCC